MTTLNQLGLPWWAVFPASALAIRTLVILPLFQIPFRKALVRRALLTPLIQARLNLARLQRQRAGLRLGVESPLIQRLINARLAQREASRAGHEYAAVPRPILTRLGSFVVLLIVAEAIRRLCGNEKGLLALLTDPFIELAGFESEGAEARATVRTDDSVESAGETRDGARPESAGEWYRPSLKTGGVPFWCPDLTLPDPTLVLPLLFAAALAASIVFAPGAARGALGPGTTKVPLTNLQRIMLSLAALSVFPALKMPSGLLLYLVANTAVNGLHTRYLARRFPFPKTPTASLRNPVTSYPVSVLPLPPVRPVRPVRGRSRAVGEREDATRGRHGASTTGHRR